jgi:hypothetical protein
VSDTSNAVAFDALAREMQELHADNERLRAELANTERLVRRQRGWCLVAAAAWVTVLGAAGFFTCRYARASFDAQSRRAHGEACWGDLRARQEELARTFLQFDGDLEVQTLGAAVQECRRRWGPLAPAQCTNLVWEPADRGPQACICR